MAIIMSEQSFLPYAKQSLSAEDIEAVASALASPIITRGPLVEAFERAVADYCGAKHAVAFNSGTAALMASYFAADVGPYDTVVTTPNTFVASVGAAMERMARPLFIDIDRATGNMQLEQLLLNIDQPSSKGKTVIVPVHFAGIPVDMQAIDAAIADYRTVVIEDAAHALGSCYKDGSRVGSCMWSQMTVFSFHPAKTITTGEGGMVTTNDDELCRLLKLYRNNGIVHDPRFMTHVERPGYYEVATLTGNYNVTEMQAALGLSQFKRLDTFIERRKALMALYREQLAGIESIRLLTPDEALSVAYHLCVVQIDFAALKKDKAKVMEALAQEGIGTQVHYIPLYRHPFFTEQSGDISDYFPEMETYYAQALSLPLYFDLRTEDVARVVAALKKILKV
jgi:UDP-4-amino-4,6-dideoxy-N-acetyl-beta-L-altrosamine transaminase